MLTKEKPLTPSKIDGVKKPDIDQRIKRILNLMNGKLQRITGGRFTRKINEEIIDYQLPYEQGNFNLYFLLSPNGNNINDYWYISIDRTSNLNIEEELADIRVLSERCSDGQDVDITFIIATDLDLSEKKAKLKKGFSKVINFADDSKAHFFHLEIWDNIGLLEKEKALGIRVTI